MARSVIVTSQGPDKGASKVVDADENFIYLPPLSRTN